ncbi:hypothetical protein, partial [Elizabethkingia meningoseptica]|uniref:hypothetical protein n=1 Tax=Elizabethkingia meningoseptica TaxID=238 RepID=UPI0031585DAB
ARLRLGERNEKDVHCLEWILKPTHEPPPGFCARRELQTQNNNIGRSIAMNIYLLPLIGCDC